MFYGTPVSKIKKKNKGLLLLLLFEFEMYTDK